MAQSKLKVIVTAAHVVQDADGAQLVPGHVYDVKDAPVIQQLIEDKQLKVVESEVEVEKTTSKTAKNTQDSASADSNPS